jgi:predicted ribonuclease YlaK
MTLLETYSNKSNEIIQLDSIRLTESTRSEKRRRRREKKREAQDIGVSIQNAKLIKINPMTENQKVAFDAWENGENLLLHGLAGTGKTFISLYLSLREILSNQSYYKKIVIVRSVVPTRDMGFLPGSIKEKTRVFELPYHGICNDLFARGDAYDILKGKHIVNFLSTSFIRGSTFNDTIVIVDEINNLTFHELDSVITRLGHNCRLILAGDYRQTDLKYHDEKVGLPKFINIIDQMPYFKHVEFGIDDIVRSDLVKSYIIAKAEMDHGDSIQKQC